jgi:hypothetical protein
MRCGCVAYYATPARLRAGREQAALQRQVLEEERERALQRALEGVRVQAAAIKRALDVVRRGARTSVVQVGRTCRCDGH